MTVDMHAHFTALAEAQPLPGSKGPPSGRGGADPASGDARTWAGHNGDRVFTPGWQAMGETGSFIDGSFDGGIGEGGYSQDMLAQHRGVYARLGTYSRLKGSRAAQWIPGARGLGSDDGDVQPGKRQARPMELQVRPSASVAVVQAWVSCT